MAHSIYDLEILGQVPEEEGTPIHFRLTLNGTTTEHSGKVLEAGVIQGFDDFTVRVTTNGSLREGSALFLVVNRDSRRGAACDQALYPVIWKRAHEIASLAAPVSGDPTQ